MNAPNLDTPRMPGGGLHLVGSETLEEDDNVSMSVRHPSRSKYFVPLPFSCFWY
jgi:hypothetical protein